MFEAVLKLMHIPGASDWSLPEYSELQARRQKQDGPELFLPPANDPASY
jgi:hypothetical protein